MSGRKKGKQPTRRTHEDLPEVSGVAPGAGGLQEDDFDSAGARPADRYALTQQPGFFDVTPAMPNAPAGNAYEQDWNKIRTDNYPSIPQGHHHLNVERDSEQGGAPSADASNMFPFNRQGHGTQPSQIPLGTSNQPPMPLPTLPRVQRPRQASALPRVQHPRPASARTGMPGISATPLQPGSANMFPVLPGGPQWQQVHGQPSALLSGYAPHFSQAGQGSFPGLPGAGGPRPPAPDQLPHFTNSHFASPDELVEYLRQPAWKPDHGDWMVPANNNYGEVRKYTVRVYNALVEIRNVLDDHSGYAALFRRGERWSNPKDIEVIAHTIVFFAMKIHRTGVTGLKSRGLGYSQEADRSLTFAQRIHFVVVLVTHFKKWARECMAQRRLEDLVANVFSHLFLEGKFRSWWSGLSEQQKDDLVLRDPYVGVTAYHPPGADGQAQIRAIDQLFQLASHIAASRQQAAVNIQGLAAPPAPAVPEIPASRQPWFQAALPGVHQNLVQQGPASGEGNYPPGLVGEWQQDPTLLLPMPAPAGSVGPLQAPQSAPTPAGLDLQNPLVPPIMDFDNPFPNLGQNDAALGVLGPGFGLYGQLVGSQPGFESVHGQPSVPAQIVENVATGGADGGGDVEAVGSGMPNEVIGDNSWMDALLVYGGDDSIV